MTTETLEIRRKRHEAGGSLAAALIRITHDVIRAEIAAEIAAARRRQRGRRGDPACTARRSTAPAPDLFAA